MIRRPASRRGGRCEVDTNVAGDTLTLPLSLEVGELWHRMEAKRRTSVGGARSGHYRRVRCDGAVELDEARIGLLAIHSDRRKSFSENSNRI